MVSRTEDGHSVPGDGDAVIATFEDADERVAATIVEAVADASGRDPLEIAPLYDAVDPDALEAILTSQPSDDLVVSFTLDGFFVRASADGWVAVTPEDEDW